jgi:ParB family chromosome partitioning protein
MAEEAVRSRLGRGLAALIGDAGTEPVAEQPRNQRRVPVEFLRPNPRNPRRAFSDSELDELASSIRERGVIQPIVVRAARGQSDAYEIIAGERRWRATQRAGVHDVPIVVVDATDREALELAIIENVQRTDLNALEEALGYEALAEEFNHSSEDLARVVGKSRSHVANTLRLLKLPDSVKAFVAEGKISAGHARALLSVPNPEAVAREVIEKGLNVRAVETLAQEAAGAEARVRKPPQPKDADTRALEQRLSDRLGLKVSIDHGPKGGSLTVRYRTLEQLDAVVASLETSSH